jgi:hypothetical protein
LVIRTTQINDKKINQKRKECEKFSYVQTVGREVPSTIPIQQVHGKKPGLALKNPPKKPKKKPPKKTH